MTTKIRRGLFTCGFIAAFKSAFVVFAGGVTPVAAQVESERLVTGNRWGTINLSIDASLGDQVRRMVDGARMRPLSMPLSAEQFSATRPIGRLDVRLSNGTMEPCTATLVADDLILTNFHCVPGKRPNPRVVGADFRLNYHRADMTRYIDTYDVDVSSPLVADRELDVSLLRVRGNPGKKYGRAPREWADARSNQPLLMIHHPGGFPKMVSYNGCQTGEEAIDINGRLIHFCANAAGSSGALLLDENAKRVVGLHKANSVIAGGYGVATPIGKIAKRHPQIAQLFTDSPRDGGVNNRRIPQINDTSLVPDIKRGLAAMSFDPGGINHRWTEKDKNAALAFSRVRGVSVEVEQPTAKLFQFIAAAQRDGFSNLACTDKQIVVPTFGVRQRFDGYKQVESKEETKVKFAGRCTQGPGDSFYWEDRCERERGPDLESKAERQCEASGGTAWHGSTTCDCTKGLRIFCDCESTVSCEIRKTIQVPRYRNERFRNGEEIQTRRECECTAKESCRR